MRRWVAVNRSILAAYAVAVGLVFVGALNASGFASIRNLRTIIIIAAFVGIAALGQTFCIITGGIDLSVPAVLSGSALVTAFLADGDVKRLYWVIPLVLLLAAVVGTVNGVLVGVVGVSPIILTLGMLSVVQGLTLVFSGGRLAPAPPTEYVVWLTQSLWIPAIWGVLAVGATVVLSYSTLGRKFYAIGVNSKAAQIAGVRTKRVLIVPYVVSAVGSALAGLGLLAWYNRAFITMGDEFLFASAVAVAVGGASILGGSGNYIGTIAGALVLTILGSLLRLFSLGTAALQIAFGLVLLFAVWAGSLEVMRPHNKDASETVGVEESP